MTLKDNILNKLKTSNAYISGSELASEFGVSRNAVWKAMNSLRDEGNIISSVKNKGYRLIAPADMLSEDDIIASMNVAASKLTLTVLDKTDSTNNVAKRMLAEGFEGNALIVANEQTNGRGRLGRNFYSPKNTGIYMTFLLQSNLKLSDAVSITTAACVAVVRAIEKVTGVVPEIKWVNDIYIGGKKICGILTEAVSDFETGTARSIIIGIGINITTDDFPEEIKNTAASLGTHTPVRNQIIAAAADELYEIWQCLPDRSCYIDCYRKYSMIIGKSIDFYINNVRHTGTAIDIDDNGALKVELASGEIKILSSGEVTVRLSEKSSC